AKRIGPNCAIVIDRIFDRAKVKEQAVSVTDNRYGFCPSIFFMPKDDNPRCRDGVVARFVSDARGLS
ncbi:hypothetical protein, partial [Bifidobacterium sp.]|uniref:hypothetical protein n=1 Tax=Bifidobacterium sp. TaxID=41200 RepID=UPI00386E1350